MIGATGRYRPVRAVIDNEALTANLKHARKLAENSRVMAVVKADAYGHGLDAAAAALAGADALAVASLDDAEILRAAGWARPICLFAGFFDEAELDTIAALSLQPVIHCFRQIDQLEAWQSQQSISAWVKVDTGMGRIGFSLADIARVRERLSAIPAVAEINIMSHLANADSPDDTTTEVQLGRFRSVADPWGCERSLANSAGLMSWPATHMEWVRPGIMLYGISPFPDRQGAELGLQPVMNFESEIISVRDFNPGDSVGYGGTWQCPEVMKVGVVACGYGDGYPGMRPPGHRYGSTGSTHNYWGAFQWITSALICVIYRPVSVTVSYSGVRTARHTLFPADRSIGGLAVTAVHFRVGKGRYRHGQDWLFAG